MGQSIETSGPMDNDNVSYTGPELETDTTLAELVGNPRYHLLVRCDWERRTIEFDTEHESVNGSPMREWHGHARSWRVPILTKADALVLVDTLRPLVARVCDGYTSEWDGSNHVARFTEDAEDATFDFDRTIDRLTHDGTTTSAGGLWDAAEWLDADPPKVSPNATDGDLAGLAAELQSTAHYEGVHLYGLDEYMDGLRAEAREAVGA